ncbi:hypothetical protein ACNOYE_37055 [Nannocystaceae bacterium ST9]
MSDPPATIEAPRRAIGAAHAGVVSLLRSDPWWLVELLEGLGLVPLDATLELLPTEAWPRGEEGRYRETRVDLVLRLWPGPVPRSPTLRVIRLAGGLGVLLEFQEWIDAMKEERWPELGLAYRPYVGRQIIVVVLTLEPEVAQWVREVMMPKLSHLQIVLVTPGTIPRSAVIDPVAQPLRALIDAMIHARDDADIERLARAILALRQLEADEAVLYEEMLLSHLGEELIMDAIRHLRATGDLNDEEYPLSNSERRSFLYTRGHRAGRERGERLGRASFVIDVLRQRGVEVDGELEATILACEDDATLQQWLTRALVVDRARALLDD